MYEKISFRADGDGRTETKKKKNEIISNNFEKVFAMKVVLFIFNKLPRFFFFFLFGIDQLLHPL